jgi:hypothetical protein
MTMLVGSPIEALHLLEHYPLAVGLVNRHARFSLQPADLARSLSALIQQFDELSVEFIDFLSPVSDVHG